MCLQWFSQEMQARFFNYGDQIILPWTDKATGKTYECPLDVVHFGDVTLADGETVPGMLVQWHYATPFGVQFNQFQAFKYCEEQLPAGTYNVIIGDTWGNNCVKGKTIPVHAYEACTSERTACRIIQSTGCQPERMESIFIREQYGNRPYRNCSDGGGNRRNRPWYIIFQTDIAIEWIAEHSLRI